MKFKVGDKVRCITREKEHHLKIGDIYTVEGFKEYNNEKCIIISIKNKKCWYYASRFELVEEKKKAEVWTREVFQFNLRNKIVSEFDFSVDIQKVIFNDKATILFYKTNLDYIPIERKIVAKCQEGDKYSKEDGLRICVLKAMKRELERELKQY